MKSQEFTVIGSTLVTLGIIFGATDLLIGYSFIGAGVLVSIISAIKSKVRSRRQSHRTGGVRND
jgi:hypothetical protein